MNIRPATEADIDAVAAIYRHYVLTTAATFEIEPPDAAEMLKRYRAIADAGLPYIVACEGGEIAGYAYAGPYRPRPAYRFTVEDSIYVAPAYQRRGVGRLLLTEVIQRCTERGCRQMIAVIGDSANTGSVRLHTSFGFRTVGVLEAVGFKFDRWVDTVLMQRSLSEPEGSPDRPCLYPDRANGS